VRNAGQPCRPVARLCITLPSDRRVQKNLTTTNIPCPLLSHIAAHKFVGFNTVYKDEKAFALPNVKKLKDYTTLA
ncbi:hypothetical protein, partial [Klebsiella pneumoniae]|uniref:hypothetical protein n=1 Tax=Klebsiella pneumoniae TaxID=573 RepID=UPI001C6E054A